MRSSKAVVVTGKDTLELRSFPLPELTDDGGVLRLEACGMCGTDLTFFRGSLKNTRYPFILGHEPVGIIDSLTDAAAKRWGVRAGDRVAVQYFTCGVCEACRSGQQGNCETATNSLGLTPVTTPPALWGGYAEHMYIPPNARVFPMSKDLLPQTAALFNALAGAISWTVERSGLRPGQTLAIMGPGQRGLASIVAARDAGASFIAVVGRGRNPYKLQLAKELGADLVIDSDRTNPADAIKRALGKGVDIAVDLTPAAEPLLHAFAVIRGGGIVIEAGGKSGMEVPGFTPDLIRSKNATIMGTKGPTISGLEKSIALLESRRHPELERLVTHAFPLERAREALLTLAGDYPDRKAMNVVMLPGQ